MVVGPPGTGKTTVAISWLLNIIVQNPNLRILITAPSNQAVNVLLQAAMKYIPHDILASLEKSSKKGEELEKVNINGYASLIVQDLIEKKKFLESGPKFSNKDLMEVNRTLKDACKKIWSIKCSNPDIKTNIDKQSKQDIRDLKSMAQEFAQSFNIKSLLEEKNHNSRRITALNLVIELIELVNKYEYSIKVYLLQRAQIVFSTLVSSGRQIISKNIERFDIILIDEAGQALVPEIFIPLKFDPQAVFLIGDPKQLPATICSQKCKSFGYENSLMHWLIEELHRPYSMLTTQYRMHSDICDWVSRLFYEGKLTTPNFIRSRPSILTKKCIHEAYLTNPSLWIDIEEGFESRNTDNPSFFNIHEAGFIIDTVIYLLEHGKLSMSQIGIISFYSGQIELLKRLFESRLKNYYNNQATRKNTTYEEWKQSNFLDIKTVDGYQGGEKDIILISMVRTSGSIDFLDDPRRLNVAMSRAKHACWIFGNYYKLMKLKSYYVKDLLIHHKNKLLHYEK